MKSFRRLIALSLCGLLLALSLLLLGLTLSLRQYAHQQQLTQISTAVEWIDGQLDPQAELLTHSVILEQWARSLAVTQLEITKNGHSFYVFQSPSVAVDVIDSSLSYNFNLKQQGDYRLQVWVESAGVAFLFSPTALFCVIAGSLVLILVTWRSVGWLIVRLDAAQLLERRSQGILLGNNETTYYEKEWPVAAGKALNSLIVQLGYARRDKARFDRMIRRNAFVDELTGLPNQTQFLNRLESEVADVDANSGVLMIIYIKGIDEINHRYGRSVGDHLIEQYGQLLLKGMDDFVDSILARFRGDQFAVILPGVAVDRAEKLAAHLLKLLQRLPLPEKGRYEDFFYIGISCYRLGDQPAEVLNLAEDALRVAQRHEGNSWHVEERDAPVDTPIKSGVRWRALLENALESRRVAFFEQMIVDANGQSIALELLARICDQHHWLMMRTFMPWAVKFGLVKEFDRLAISRAMERISDAPAPVSINLDAKTLLEADIMRQLVMWAINVGRQGAGRLIIEVSEYQLTHLDRELITRFSILRDKGICLAVDRAGQSVENTHYIDQIKPCYIKLHPSLVRDVHQRQINRLAISSLIACADTNVEFIAVGVEISEEWHALLRLGVTGGQGHYFHREEALYGINNEQRCGS